MNIFVNCQTYKILYYWKFPQKQSTRNFIQSSFFHIVLEFKKYSVERTIFLKLNKFAKKTKNMNFLTHP